MLFSWLYVLLNSLSAILRQIGGNIISPSLILLIGSIFAITYFHAINMGKIRFIYQRCWSNKSVWLLMNVYVTIMWLSAVYSPAMIGGALYVFMFFATLGIFGSFSFFLKDSDQNTSQIISLCGLLGLLVFMVYKNLSLTFTSQEILGIGYAIIGGISSFYYSKASSTFMKSTQLSATQVLAVRFFVTIIACLILMPPQSISSLNPSNLCLILAIALFCLIVPLYFIQKGIEKAGPDRNAIICSTTPLVTSLLEASYYRVLQIENLSISIAYCFFAALPFLLHQIKRHLNKG